MTDYASIDRGPARPPDSAMAAAGAGEGKNRARRGCGSSALTITPSTVLCGVEFFFPVSEAVVFGEFSGARARAWLDEKGWDE